MSSVWMGVLARACESAGQGSRTGTPQSRPRPSVAFPEALYEQPQAVHTNMSRTSDHTMNVPRVMVRGPLRHSYVAIRSTCAGRGSAQSEHRGPCNLLSPGNARVNLIGTASTAYLRSPVFPVQPAPGIWDAQGVATGQGLTGLSIWVSSAHRGRSGMKISNTGRRRSSSNEPVVRAAGRQARFGGNAVQNMVWRTASTGSMPGMLSGS